MTDGPSQQLQQAIGGWRGALESAAPAVLFLATYQVTHDLPTALRAALAVAVIAAVARIVRRGPLQFVISGLIGVAFSAWFSMRSGQAKDFFVPGLITNVLWGAAYLLSVLMRYPLIGILVGSLEGEPLKWVRSVERRRAANLATLAFAALFAVRLLIEVPLYLADALNALGTVKLALGWPAYVFTVWVAYRLMKPMLGSAPAEDLL